MKVLQDGPLANILNRLIDLILLNVLWFLCSLPLFTLGASTCAVYEVVMRYSFHEDPPVIRTFFHAFRKHFKKSIVLLLIFLGAGLFLSLDLWAAVRWDIPIQFLMVVIILSASYFYLAVLTHVFPVLTYYDSGIRESIQKAFILSMSNGIFTVFIMMVNLMPLLLILLFPNYFGQILFLYLAVGFSVTAFLCAMHLARLFDPKRAKEADELEDEQRRLRNRNTENPKKGKNM